MPTVTAIALDRLLESGASRSMSTAKNIPDPKLERRNSTPNSKLDEKISVPKPKLDRRSSVPNPNPNLERRNGTSTTSTMGNKHHWAQPALYATPEPTPVPDSPSSFPPSPYIINHKRRGPRLLKSSSEDVLPTRRHDPNEGNEAAGNEKNMEKEGSASINDDNFTSKEAADSMQNDDSFTFNVPCHVQEGNMNGSYNEEPGSSELSNSLYLSAQNGSIKSVEFNVERGNETDDFFDPQDSMSVKSITEGESTGGGDRSLNLTTPSAEFYDAWEELSSDSGPQQPLYDIEAELRELRLSLLMEIEKRKQAEEALNNMRSQWLRIREQLSLVGITLPKDPSTDDSEQPDDPAEDMCRQIDIARFVSGSIGRGLAKAEVEVEVEAQMELKNFEIARLWDKLHYYEAVNHEMSQRNQEVVESARRLRQRRKRRQRWVWGSIAAAATVGATALAWSYFPIEKASSANQTHAPKVDHS